MWFALLIPWVVTAFADTVDRQARTVPLPDGRALVIEVTIGSVRISGWDRPEVEIAVERHVPAPAHLARLPIEIEETPSRVVIRAVQADGGTDAALRADVVVRAPRAALIERVQVLEGRIQVIDFHGSITAGIRRGDIDADRLSGTVRLESGIGSIHATGARLSAGGVLRLRTFNGDVRLWLDQRPPHARIMALALNGDITSTIPLTMKRAWGPRWGEATIGDGDPVISLDVVTGTIEIRSP